MDYASLIERRKSMTIITNNNLGSQGVNKESTQIVSARSGGFTARNVQNSYLASLDRIITADELKNSLNEDLE